MNATMTCEPTTNCQPATTREGPVYRPNVDIRELENELILEADMPGASPAEIEVQYEKGTLSLRAKVAARHAGRHGAIRREFGVGDFQRSFTLGQEIDASGIRAEYRHGVLTLHLPKTASARPRKIAVQAG